MNDGTVPLKKVKLYGPFKLEDVKQVVRKNPLPC